MAERSHGSWYLRLELGAGVDGRRRRVRRGGFVTRKDAEEALSRLRGPTGRAVTVGEWLARWLRAHRGAVSTVAGYAGHIRLYLEPQLGQLLLGELSVTRVQEMFTAIAYEHEKTGRPIRAATLNRIRATLRSALNAAAREGLIDTNPAALAVLPAAPRPRAVVWTAARVEHWAHTGERPAVAVWTAEQTAAFLHAIRGHRLYAAYHLIALRGLRRGEAAGLRADTYTSVLPQVAQTAAEKTATHVLQAGWRVPGTKRHRRPSRRKRRTAASPVGRRAAA
ncbi:Arm DNA-binding domain-containing protein [Actinomadura sp. HBU206391]|uniref:Arm DNA-binding domain-containing protein n=1 Tax=Actinomadura sp. HBU206391 TaxID=2731692 RepID=UPI0016502193|nr:Arm DNA-binding domain-containing protein [Actinomadura sp. HBU206391]MBC6458127.1 Arm DNA-binding domain-containing protein [Actinomadura sp. HBU206391]